MIRVTTQRRVQIAWPDQTWSCTPGSNHFDADMPHAVAAQLEKLQADGAVTVEIIDDGTVSAWTRQAAQ